MPAHPPFLPRRRVHEGPRVADRDHNLRAARPAECLSAAQHGQRPATFSAQAIVERSQGGIHANVVQVDGITAHHIVVPGVLQGDQLVRSVQHHRAEALCRPSSKLQGRPRRRPNLDSHHRLAAHHLHCDVLPRDLRPQGARQVLAAKDRQGVNASDHVALSSRQHDAHPLPPALTSPYPHGGGKPAMSRPNPLGRDAEFALHHPYGKRREQHMYTVCTVTVQTVSLHHGEGPAR